MQLTRMTERRLLWLLLAVAAVIRAFYLGVLLQTDLALVPLLDCQVYHEWAVRLVEGDWGWYDAYWMGPLYPHLVALVYFLLGISIPAVLVLQMGLTLVNVVLVFRLGHILLGESPDDGDRRPAAPLLAAALYAFYGAAVFYAGLVLMATLVTTFLLLIALQTARADRTGRTRHWFLLGTLIGLAALARGNVLILAPAVPLLVGRSWRGRLRQLAAVGCGVLLLVLPVTVRNVIMADDFVLLTTNGGLNLLIGQQAEHRGLFAHVSDSHQAEFDPSQEMALENEIGRDLKGSEVSAILMRRAWERFRGDLGAMPMLYLRKTYRFWSGYELPQIESYDYWREQFVPLRFLPVPFVLLSAAGLLGLRWLPPRSRWILATLIMGYFLGLLPFFPTARYRLPVVPLLTVSTVALICALAARRARLKVWLPSLAGVMILLWPSWSAFSDTEVLWRVRLLDVARAALQFDLKTTLRCGREAEEVRPGLADTPYQLALQLETIGAHVEAVAALRVAEARAPDNPLVPYRIGRNLEQIDDDDGALEAFARAAELYPGWEYPWIRSGLILMEQGRPDEALEAYETAFRIAPGHRRVRANLGSLLAESGELERARRILADLTVDEPFYVNGWFNLALLEWNAGNREQARGLLEKAAALKNLTPAERVQVRNLQAVFDRAGS